MILTIAVFTIVPIFLLLLAVQLIWRLGVWIIARNRSKTVGTPPPSS